MSVPRFQHVLHPEFFLIRGDVGMYGMHDGKNFPIGCETPFLSSFELPWRYVRNPGIPGYGDYKIYHLGQRLLRQPSDPENWPKVVSATAETDGRTFFVRAEVDFAPDTVRLWWNHSSNRAYNTEGQPEWQSVDMLQTGGFYVSPSITEIPRGHEAAWYVEAEKEITGGGYFLYRRDASPVQFVFRNPPETCIGLVIPDWCE